MTATIASALSGLQRNILAFIRAFYRTNGCAPLLSEIGVAVGLESLLSLDEELHELKRMGWIRRHPERPDALIVLSPVDGGE